MELLPVTCCFMSQATQKHLDLINHSGLIKSSFIVWLLIKRIDPS